jgi:hypothetical protein
MMRLKPAGSPEPFRSQFQCSEWAEITGNSGGIYFARDCSELERVTNRRRLTSVGRTAASDMSCDLAIDRFLYCGGYSAVIDPFQFGRFDHVN